MLQYKTKLEKSEKVQKSQNAGSPLGGWGAGSKEPTQTWFFIIKGYNNQQINWKNVAWFLYRMNPRAYKVHQ